MRRFVLYLPQPTISHLLKNIPRDRSVFVGNISDAVREARREFQRGFEGRWRRYWLERGWATQEEVDELEIRDVLEDRAREKEAQRYKKEQNKLYWDERSNVIQRIKAMDTKKVVGNSGMRKEVMRRPLRKAYGG